ncbi:MAG: hypothetical protein QOD07_22 [Frankiaceae bacterium]|jgi:hypothetical protein|nr:hypothetical protein [Frankiaceae bacterium]
MRRGILLAVLALGTSGLAVPGAFATSPDVMHGGCYFDTVPATADSYVGVIGDQSATTTGGSPPAPIGATVTCWIQVNGFAAPGTTHSYGDVAGEPGVQHGQDPVAFTAQPGDYVGLCWSVAFADHTTADDCSVDASPQFPPQPVVDVVNSVVQTVHDVLCGGAHLCLPYAER